MGHFDENLAALIEHHPDIAEKIRGVRVEPKYTVDKQPGCVPNVICDGRPYYIGKVVKYVESFFANAKMDGAKVALFLGMGLMYEVDYFCGAYGDKLGIREIIVIERDPEMFVAALNGVKLVGLLSNPHIRFFVGVTPEQLFVDFRDMFKANMELLLLSPATVPLFTYATFYMGGMYYKMAYNAYVEAAWNVLQGYGNDPADSLIGLENMLDNVDVILQNPGIKNLYGKFAGMTAVVVAAGPSLAKNVDRLRDLQDKALIISCDASLKYLLAHGVRPHLVTSLEREHEVEGFFNNLTDVDDIYMAACPVLYHHVFDAYNGPKVIVYRNFDHFKWLGIDRGILDIQVSSANMAYTIAEALGCTTIAFVGQDLAFGEDGSTHAMETPWSSEGEEMLDVPGNLGGTVKTTSFWHSINRAFQVDISKNKDRVRTLNCTEGGAAIPGTFIGPLAQLVESVPDHSISISDVLREALSIPNPSGEVDALESLLNTTESDLEQMIDLCRAGKIAVSNLACTTIECWEDIPVMEAAGNEVLKYRVMTQGVPVTWQQFLMHVVQSFHLKFEIDTILHAHTLRDALIKYGEWYDNIGGMIGICLESLRKAKGKICQQK